MKRYAAIGEASKALGVSTPTMRRWERNGTAERSMPRMRHGSHRERCDHSEEQNREFHGVSLWGGRLWLWLQNRNETSLNEAGIQHKAPYGEVWRSLDERTRVMNRVTHDFFHASIAFR